MVNPISLGKTFGSLRFRFRFRLFFWPVRKSQIEKRIASFCMPNKREWIHISDIYVYVVYIILNTRCTNDIYKCFSLSELIAQLPLSGGTKRRRVASPRFPMDTPTICVAYRSEEEGVCIIMDQQRYMLSPSLSFVHYLSCA